MTDADTNNELLPMRLNAEPAVFRGCSLPELMMLTVISVAFWVPVWLVICGLFGFMMMGVGVGILSTIASVVIGATLLQKAKRGRPVGFYQLRLRLLLEDYRLIKPQFVRASQVWDIGRTCRR